ncbi:MAG TPA: beta-propeller fold lactonase family protein [Streptosporangiaceae bacterium]|nr:beta-propeller fold lactonase family protein [Streptosporangiaceae bacterium]
MQLRLRPAIFAVGALMLSLLVPAGPAFGQDGQPARPRVLYISSEGAETSSIAMFTVDRQTGALTPLANPLPAGISALGVVVTPDGRFVYVADTDGNQVLSYSVGRSGALTKLNEAQADGDPFEMAMAPNGRTLYATVQVTDQVESFSVGTNGRLTSPASVPSGGTNPRGIAVSPDGRFVYVTNGTRNPAVPGTLVTFAVTDGGSLSLVQSINIGRFGSGIIISPDGRFLYAESQATNQIHAYQRGADGLLTELPGSPVASPNDPEGIIITPDAGHIYAAATGENSDGTPGSGPGNVQAFGVQPGGGLGPAQLFDSGSLPNALAISPSGRFLYGSNGNSNNIVGFAIGPDGALSQLPGPPTSQGIDSPGPEAMAMLPNQGPTARFSINTSKSGTLARFDATASSDPDGRVARYDWDFGDGTVLPDGGPTPNHSYTRSGTFTVTLTVTDDEGCSDQQVFTGQSVLCNGSPAAQTVKTITVR